MFNPIGAVSNQLTRVVSLAAGNTISEKDSDTYTKYGYNSSFLEFLGLSSEVSTFANDGQKLRVTRFDEKTGWINAAYPARIRTTTNDLLNDITITAEKDSLGLIHKETRKNGHLWRDYLYHYTNPLWAGFGLAEATDEFDRFTGLPVSRSQTLDFNDQGGSIVKQDLLIENRSVIKESGQKGQIIRLFEGEKVDYNNGTIIADTVIISEYQNPYWSARTIASLSEKWSWNVSVQAVSQLIHSTEPLRKRRIDTAYGNYQTLEVEYTKPSLGTQMSIFVELAGGKPVRFVAPSRIIEVKFNSLGIEEALPRRQSSGWGD